MAQVDLYTSKTDISELFLYQHTKTCFILFKACIVHICIRCTLIQFNQSSISGQLGCFQFQTVVSSWVDNLVHELFPIYVSRHISVSGILVSKAWDLQL